ncbi:MAG: hypothetical protein AAFN74_27050, partial [Myxococcota bacterium]
MNFRRIRGLRLSCLWGLLSGLGGLSGCASPQVAAVAPSEVVPPPAAEPPPSNAGAPAWATAGDRTSTAGFRFICQGEGESPEAAGTAARAFCEDKICKLCGVEVESVVRSKETLTGVEMSRQVVERCRRVRTKPSKVVRQSVDCPEAGRCFAWVEVDYPRAQRDRDCREYADDNFDDPAVCQAQLDIFAQTFGYSADSIRRRIATLEKALAACGNIDVRPTPLLNALDERLRRGMTRFTEPNGRAPRYISQYWLASHAPTWTAYDRATTFTGKIELLLGYLRAKPPLLDVIETSLLPPDQLDTQQGLSTLLARMQRAPVDDGYGAANVHFFAVDQLRQMHRKKMFDQPLGPLWAMMSNKYPASSLDRWNHIVTLTWLAEVDDVVSAKEWGYLTQSPRWWRRAAQMLLEVEDHGAPGARGARFRSALKRALSEGTRKSDEQRARLIKRVMPTSPFVLDVETLIPSSARPVLYSFDALQDVHRRCEDDLTKAQHDRFMARLTRALADVPAASKPARSFCGRLAKRMAFFDERGVDVPSGA